MHTTEPLMDTEVSGITIPVTKKSTITQ